MSAYNREIGAKIKSFRKKCGITQMGLANSVGVSYQQIQKYENGETKITVERLKQVADIFKIPINIFLENNRIFDKIYTIKEDVEYPDSLSINDLQSDELSLLKLYRSIKDDRVKEGLLWQLKGIHHHQTKNS